METIGKTQPQTYPAVWPMAPLLDLDPAQLCGLLLHVSVGNANPRIQLRCSELKWCPKRPPGSGTPSEDA